jgi:MoaA/NifB/PqqE/SkfB family radical SAM enzyme/glycosyltransferase involved in cell wall biosynthesis
MGVSPNTQRDLGATDIEPVRVCILTRGDLFPTDHGAAVKIVRTAEALSRQGAPCFVVTDDRDHYWRFDDGVPTAVAYPVKTRAAMEWPGIARMGFLAERICDWVGYAPDEFFLYRPQFDPAWWLRAVAVGSLERIDVFQAEFPGYGVPAWIAAKLVGQERPRGSRPRSCIVQHNVEWDRLAEFGHEVRKIRAIEQWALDRVDEVIAVSLDDKRRMVAAGTDAAKITVIPHGVSLEPFGTVAGTEHARLRARYGVSDTAPLLFFHGTLNYRPNAEAVRFIVDELLPIVIAARPDARVIIAGMNPPAYYAHPAVVFPGSVDDVAAHVAMADVCLCPIELGGGTRMKLLEYMAGGKAIVSTTKGAEGIPYVDGRELVIADGAPSFAEAVLDLLGDEHRRAALGGAARRFVRGLDWAQIAQAYSALYRGDGRGETWRPKPPIDAHLPATRAPSKPLTMLLLINRGCNLKCSFCDLWQDFENMPLARVLPLLDQAVEIGTQTLVITGGEPFIYPDLFAVVREAKRRGLSVNITTNGTLIDKNWDALMASGVDSLSFSIDGMPPTHDAIRGQKGAWRRTVAGLERVCANTEIATSVYFVVTNQNVHELTQVHDLAISKGAKFDFWPVNDAEELYLKTPADHKAWQTAVAHIAKADPEVAARSAYYAESMRYHGGEKAPVRCLGLVDQYGVTYDGRLLPCCVWGGEGLTVGNVFDRPLTELWTDPRVQAFREKMYSEGCEAGCYNHSLYEFTVATGEPFWVERA